MNVNSTLSNTPSAHHVMDQPRREVTTPQRSERSVIEEVSKQDVKTAVDKLNDFASPVQTNLKFVFHEDLNEYYVTVVDPITKEVVREIPPKKMLDMYAAMTKYMGILIDERI